MPEIADLQAISYFFYKNSGTCMTGTPKKGIGSSINSLGNGLYFYL
jgi:hypothetical protein